MRLAQCLRRFLTRFRDTEAGVAAVEFALILPIMIFVYIGSVEASALITVDRKVQNVSGAVGDLVARSKEKLTSADLQDYVRAAGGIMSPYGATQLRQVITQVRVSADGLTATVVWSRGYEHETAKPALARAENSSYSLPAAIRSIAKNQYVIVAETSYSYRPLFGIVINRDIPLYRENFYLPRFGGQIALN
jgi:Flp pilus assembly protein TadG